MEKMYGHRRLPIRAKVFYFITITTLNSTGKVKFSSSSIWTASLKHAVSAQGCCHFISGPHFKVHQDQRPQQKICVYDNYQYFHLFRIESLCSLGQIWDRASQCHKKHVQDWISDNLQASSYMHCREVLKMHGDCSNRGADSSPSAFIPLFKLWDRNQTVWKWF